MKKHAANHFLSFIACGIVLLAGHSYSFAEPYETIINNGSPQNRVDIAILGDGYTAAQMAQFRSDVQQFMGAVFAQEPYREYQRYFNVHRIDVISNQSGADHPERGVFVDTAFDAAYNCTGIQRLICINTPRVNQVIAASLPAGHFDIRLVLVNDVEYGGSGGSVPVASIAASAAEIILHEVGHSFGLLADEYAGGGPACDPNNEPPEPNATRETQRASIKWNSWIDIATPIPTTTFAAGIPGLYVGAKYCDAGLYRPTYNSKMRTLGFPFEQINTEQLVKRVYNFVAPIDASSPAGANVPLLFEQQQNFTITTQRPFMHDLVINWTLDGMPAGTGASLRVSASALASGLHTVEAVVNDPTPFVRHDPSQVLRQTRTWYILLPTSVTGRVTTPGGLGLRNAVVSLTDDFGVRLTATTSSFGLYNFDSVTPGQTYYMAVDSKRYRFASRGIAITENLTGVDFIGLE